MSPRHLLPFQALPLLLILSACASAGGRNSPGAGLDAGALALRQAEFEAARERLVSVRQICGEARLGRQALLLLSAMELDPRNPAGDPDLGATYAALYLARPETFPWTRPVAEQLYLQALRLGGEPASGAADPLLEEIASRESAPEACERSDWSVVGGGEPPSLGGGSLDSRPGSGSRPGDESQRLKNRIAELEAELDRIRATLRP
ncbi:MAG: hypothetical protein ACREMK_03185 [Gemmatimonadota bacterium]